MAKTRPKAGIITFKADESLLQAIRGVPNRSEFIRAAILAAIDGACPLCKGTGILTPNQKRHWDTFAVNHSVGQCRKCNEFHLLCGHEGKAS